jgi:hypothetical protein
MQNNRRKIISSYAGRKSDGWRYFVCIQRSEEPTIKLRVLNKECLLYHANICKADLEQQRQKLGMTNWDAYFTFLKGVLCDGKGNIEVTQVLQSKYCRFFADNFQFRLYDFHSCRMTLPLAPRLPTEMWKYDLFISNQDVRH